ncbi:MAG: transposase [Archaeoglobaceae archaeon]
MHLPIVIDPIDYRWELLKNILNTFDLRKTKMVIASYIPIKKVIPMLKVVTTSMFFSTTITHVLEELRVRKDLRNFLGVKECEVPRKSYLYSFLSKFSLNSFLSMVSRILNSITKRRARNTRIIVDCTDVSVDINYFRKPVRQRDLEGKEYRWGYSTKGKFIGMKLTLVMEYPSLKPLLFLIHPANKHEARIYPEIMDELRRRRISRKGDTILMDKGFYAYKNYLIGLNEYRLVPVIFPRSNFNQSRLDGLLSYPLDIFEKNLEKEKVRIKKIRDKLMAMLSNWKRLKGIRSVIEDVFKLSKSMGLKGIHRYTKRSVHKYAAMNVLLVGIIASLGFKEKKVIQRLAES